MKTRTDIDVLSGESVAVQLGKKEFLIAPQPRGRAAKWAAEYLQRMERGEQLLDPKNLEKLSDLFYSYSPEIGEAREWIEENATQGEFAKAFAVMGALSCGPLTRIPLLSMEMTAGVTINGNGTVDTPTQ